MAHVHDQCRDQVGMGADQLYGGTLWVIKKVGIKKVGIKNLVLEKIGINFSRLMLLAPFRC